MRKYRNSFVVFFAVSALLGVALVGGLFRSPQEKLTDLLFTAQRAPAHTVIVAIDEESFAVLGQWPWPRAVFADLIAHLQQAAVIGIDVNFKEASGRGSGDDAALERAITSSRVPVVVTSEFQSDGSLIEPIEPVRRSALLGFANLSPALDGVVRNVRFSREQRASFALQIARQYGGASGEPLASVPAEPVRIRYLGPDETFTRVSVTDVLENKVPLSLIQNAIVLVGATVTDLHDFHQTPFGLVAGVEIQANIIATLLDQTFYRSNGLATAFSVILLSLATVWLTTVVKRLSLLILAVVGLAVLYNISAFISFDRFFILDLFYPNLSILLSAGLSVASQYLTTEREKRFIQETFSRYLAPQVIHELLHDPSKLALGGKKEQLTILFSDIRNFTTISEGMTPEQLTRFLNEYLGRMTNLVLEHQGVIDKYIGDAIMAFWGAPLPNSKHAIFAVISALRMVSELKEFNQYGKEKGYPTIDIGIGINSGEVTVGNMGSERRFDYTVMGDNVNLASRLEGLTKTYGVNIIVSERTVQAIRKQDQRHSILQAVEFTGTRKHQIVLRELDHVRVKGKKEGVIIYEVVPEFKQEQAKETASLFDRGRALYYEGKWKEAAQLFEQVLASSAKDGPSRALLERCTEFMDRPPKEWHGVFELTHK